MPLLFLIQHILDPQGRIKRFFPIIFGRIEGKKNILRFSDLYPFHQLLFSSWNTLNIILQSVDFLHLCNHFFYKNRSNTSLNPIYMISFCSWTIPSPKSHWNVFSPSHELFLYAFTKWSKIKNAIQFFLWKARQFFAVYMVCWCQKYVKLTFEKNIFWFYVTTFQI